jgi:hypothetical protein
MKTIKKSIDDFVDSAWFPRVLGPALLAGYIGIVSMFGNPHGADTNVRYRGQDKNGQHIVQVHYFGHEGPKYKSLLFDQEGKLVKEEDMANISCRMPGQRLLEVVRETDFPASVELSRMHQQAMDRYQALQNDQK